MRILIHGINYSPELTGIGKYTGEMAEWLAGHGHEVRVVTASPKFAMGVGGTFDIVAGKTKRAPVWMQRTGLEWLFRLASEPGRLWKRYLVTNSLFLWYLIRERF